MTRERDRDQLIPRCPRWTESEPKIGGISRIILPIAEADVDGILVEEGSHPVELRRAHKGPEPSRDASDVFVVPSRDAD